MSDPTAAFVGLDNHGYEQYDVEVETSSSRISETFTFVKLKHCWLIAGADNRVLGIDDDGCAEIVAAIAKCRKAMGKGK
jgi:hypothetical protein